MFQCSLFLRRYSCRILLCQKLFGWRMDITIQHGKTVLNMSTIIHQIYKGIHGGFITSERATSLLCFGRMSMVSVLYSLATMELLNFITSRHVVTFLHLKVLVTLQLPLSFLSDQLQPSRLFYNSAPVRLSALTRWPKEMWKPHPSVSPAPLPKSMPTFHSHPVQHQHIIRLSWMKLVIKHSTYSHSLMLSGIRVVEKAIQPTSLMNAWWTSSLARSLGWSAKKKSTSDHI